jgi:hypothetical protein
LIDLGTFGGYERSASSINRSGQVAGFALNSIPDQYSLVGAFFLGSPTLRKLTLSFGAMAKCAISGR